MNKKNSLPLTCCAILGLSLALGLGGCRRPIGELELTSFKDPVVPQTFEVKLWEAAYYIGPGQDYHIVARAVHEPAADGTGGIVQLLHIHMFWRPWPGKTFDNSSMIDAILRYAILTDQGAAMYDGTAYVFVRKNRDGKLKIKLEGGRLQLAKQEGATPEILGSARLEGKMIAEFEPGLAVELRRELDLRAGVPAPAK